MTHRPTITYDGNSWYWNCTCGDYSRSGADSDWQCRLRYAAEHEEVTA